MAKAPSFNCPTVWRRLYFRSDGPCVESDRCLHDGYGLQDWIGQPASVNPILRLRAPLPDMCKINCKYFTNGELKAALCKGFRDLGNVQKIACARCCI
jgi:hypothetical protein